MPDWFNRISMSGGINADLIATCPMAIKVKTTTVSQLTMRTSTPQLSSMTDQYFLVLAITVLEVVAGSIKGGTYSYAYPPGLNMVKRTSRLVTSIVRHSSSAVIFRLWRM